MNINKHAEPTTNVRLPESIYRALTEQAIREERTITATLIRAVRAYLESEDDH